jgi:hypothetical protein
LSFSIEAIKTNDNGEVEYQWGSIPNSEMSIVKGIQRADIPEEGVETDIISQVLQSANEAKKYADQVFELYGDINAFGSTVSSNTKRITNLEQGIPHELFVTDDTVAYTKYAPPRALPYAEINKFGGKVTEIRSGGANMVNSALASQSTTTNGITFTNNGDGSFTVNGEASAQATYYIHQIAKGNTLPLKSGVSYTLSGNAPKQVGVSVYDEKWKTNVSISFESSTFTISDDTLKYGFYLYVPAGTKVENVTVYPMLNVGTEAAPFKPYKETVDTFIIPAEVQALDGYGDGNNYIDFDEQIFVYFGNNEPMETDISHLIGTDNFIRVEGGGTVTFVNAENLPISSEMTYMLKEETV